MNQDKEVGIPDCVECFYCRAFRGAVRCAKGQWIDTLGIQNRIFPEVTGLGHFYVRKAKSEFTYSHAKNCNHYNTDIPKDWKQELLGHRKESDG